MLASIPEVFPFFKRGVQGRYFPVEAESPIPSIHAPSLKLTTDRQAYRPGDTILATIEVICNEQSGNAGPDYVLLENLVVEVKGIEKLDPQWLLTPEPARGSKQRRGERIILESSPTTIITDVIFEHGTKKTYLVRTALPKVLPPSYKGTVVRYLYYLMVSLHWSVAVIANGHNGASSSKPLLPPVELRTPLNIWTMPNNSGLTMEDPHHSKDYWGIVPQSVAQMEIYWKEKNDENDWTRASDVLSEIEDEVASQCTESVLHSPEKGSLVMSFERIIQLQSPAATPKAPSKESSFRRPSMSGLPDLRRPNVLTALAVDTDTEGPDVMEGSQLDFPNISKDGHLSERNTQGRESLEFWGKNNRILGESEFGEDFNGGNVEHDFAGGLPRSPSGPFGRRRSYNIRFDDEILARFSPRNPDSTYYFGDVVGGVLNFYLDEGSIRCLEITAILETHEVLNPAFIHPSRKNSPVITKVQADYYEVVVDMLQTHFVFSIPHDGPPSFATPHVSLQWVLKFEFVTTARNVNWAQCQHPLLVEEREKGEWSIPLLVHAPLPRTQKSKVRSERLSFPRMDSFGESASSSGRIPPLVLPPSSSEVLLNRDHMAPSSLHLN